MDYMTKEARLAWRGAHALVLALLSLLLIGGAQAAGAAETGPITETNVVQRVATAKTAADHEALAQYYQVQAKAAAEEVQHHEAMLKSYERVGGKAQMHMDDHCKALIRSYRAEEKAFEELAGDHAKLAKSLEGGQH